MILKDRVMRNYDEVKEFSEGLAAVKMHGRWGYINTNGTVVVPLVLDEAKPFKDGFASVKRLGRWTTISSMGIEVGKEIATDEGEFCGMRKFERGGSAGQFLGVD